MKYRYCTRCNVNLKDEIRCPFCNTFAIGEFEIKYDIKCDYCKRKLPNKSFKLEKKCKWCDDVYRRK